MLSFIILCFACGAFFFSTISEYFPAPSPVVYPWYGRLVTLGLFLWTLSEVIARWPGGR
jgi:hypothetical protein